MLVRFKLNGETIEKHVRPELSLLDFLRDHPDQASEIIARHHGRVFADNHPDGGAFDAATWDEAMMFPGAEQIAAGHWPPGDPVDERGEDR